MRCVLCVESVQSTAEVSAPAKSTGNTGLAESRFWVMIEDDGIFADQLQIFPRNIKRDAEMMM